MAAITGEYDAVVFDCDGVLYLGDKLIDGALATLRALRDRHGLRVFFVTNNSRIDAAGFARKFAALGLGEFADADNGSMWTSTSATTRRRSSRTSKATTSTPRTKKTPRASSSAGPGPGDAASG